MTLTASTVLAAVPVFDAATYGQAAATAANTSTIIELNSEILETVNATLDSFTGNRSSEAAEFQDTALGASFNFGQAPSFADLMGSFQIDFGGLSIEFQTNASELINGFELVTSLSGLTGDDQTTNDKAYNYAVSTISQVAGIIAGVEKASQQRTQSFIANGQKIGSAADVKGSIDQNSQLAVQNGLAVNELIGTMNTVAQSVNLQNIKEAQGMSQAKKFMNSSSSFTAFE